MKVTLVTSDDDWEAIYVDGVLKCEDYKLTIQDILESLGVVYNTVSACNYLSEEGACPQLLRDLVEDNWLDED
jgi:hypothetical protein